MASHAVPSDDAIDQLLRSKNEIQPPAALAANARIGDYHAEYKRSIEHAEEFWADIAGELEWIAPWKKVFQWTYPTFQWFVGAKCNITHNCLDRQVKSGRKNKVAYIWTGEDGSEQQITYGQLLDYVCRIANGLKSLGVKKGDRVIIYMPLGMEGVASMLACARIGAVHSVVYAGFSVQALRSRIEDAQARVIVTADIGYRRGKRVGLRSIVDEAIDGLEIVQKVVVLRRLQPPIELGAAHEVDFQDLIRKQSAHCPPEVMEAEDPLYILYTSGTTGKPKGVVHVHGGYMVGTYYHMTRFWDIRDDDVFFCTSDIGWVVGHSYIVYAPLLAGATTLFREGAIDYPDPAIVWELVEKYRASVEGRESAPGCDRGSGGLARQQDAAEQRRIAGIAEAVSTSVSNGLWRSRALRERLGKNPQCVHDGGRGGLRRGRILHSGGSGGRRFECRRAPHWNGRRGGRAGEPPGCGRSSSDRAAGCDQGRKHQGLRDSPDWAPGFAGTGDHFERSRPARAWGDWRPSGDRVSGKIAEDEKRQDHAAAAEGAGIGTRRRGHFHAGRIEFARSRYLTAPTVKPALKRSRNRLYINAMGRLAIRQAAISAPQ